MVPAYRISGRNDPQETPVLDWSPPEKYQGDPLAQVVRWTPCAPATNSDALPKLVEKSGQSIEFHFSDENKLVVGCGCLSMSLTLLSWFVWLAFVSCGFDSRWDSLATRIWSGIGALLGIPLCLYFVWYLVSRELPRLAKPIRFDKLSGYRVSKGHAFTGRRGKSRSRWQHLGFSGPHKGPLSNIHALQIIREEPLAGVRAGGQHGYELNLVLGTGERVNVFDTIRPGSLQQYARRLQKLLGVPVWDDSGRGYWRYESNVGDAPRDGKAAGLILLKAIWLGITGRGHEVGSWVWVGNEPPDASTDE